MFFLTELRREILKNYLTEKFRIIMHNYDDSTKQSECKNMKRPTVQSKTWQKTKTTNTDQTVAKTFGQATCLVSLHSCTVN